MHRHAGGIPRRINTLCSRVLLSGALEEIHTITGGMVDETAEELNRDLGAGLELRSNDAVPRGDDRDDLVRRIEDAGAACVPAGAGIQAGIGSAGNQRDGAR